MERKIGETFEFEGKTYEVRKENLACIGCAFAYPENRCTEVRKTRGACIDQSREDGNGVIFVECGQDKENTPKEQVNHPSHYNNYDVEVIEMMRRIWGDEEVAIWAKLTAFKYRMRMGTKDDNPIEQDLAKEKWYLEERRKLEEDE